MRAALIEILEEQTRAIFSERTDPIVTKNIGAKATRESSNGHSHPLESRVEIRLQILDVFEADGKAQGGTWRIPRRRAAITPAIEGNDKALEAAP